MPKPANSQALYAAIDVGSNGIRMVISELHNGFLLRPLENFREPIRLGADVFTKNEISERNLKRTVQAFVKFKEILTRLKVNQVRAVATSATRESFNRDVLLEAVRRESGIQLELIAGEEEARLVYMAVNRRLPLGDRPVLVVDIGGGSVELIFGSSGQIRAIESLKMGTVRMLTKLQDRGTERKDFVRRSREYVDATRGWVEQRLAEQSVEVFVGTGGNVEAIGDLAKKLLGRERNDLVTRADLDLIVERLESLSPAERTKKLGLRADRADVIMPAAIVLQSLLRQCGAETLVIPRVGLKDGVLEDMVRFRLAGQGDGIDRAQVLTAVKQLSSKYDVDLVHSRQVSELALALFDQTKILHKLGDTERFLLEIASLLHDIGKFINFSAHHKHSEYILLSSPIIGLTEAQRHVVACMARYHRKSHPTLQHLAFRELSIAERNVVTRLSAFLRLAEALDAEHGCRVEHLQVKLVKNKLILSLEGKGDMLLERWSAEGKGSLLDKALGAKLVVAS
jgi:exopolyphosphatase/guanosine-5'-triphosphate,3'-diphosphate pyrophosphatase